MPRKLSRIMIIGGPGSGKSTLARAISGSAGLPALHMDQMFWAPGWVPRPVAEYRVLVQQAITADEWVFDGNNSATFAARAARAELIVFLDLPTPLRLWRIVLRVLRWRGRVRFDAAPGCPEKFDPVFLVWAWNWNRDFRPKMLDKAEALNGNPPMVRLTSAREVRAFLKDGLS